MWSRFYPSCSLDTDDQSEVIGLRGHWISGFQNYGQWLTMRGILHHHYLLPTRSLCGGMNLYVLPLWLRGKESACQCRRGRFNPWVGKISWRRKWQPTPVFLPGKSHGWRSLGGYSPWGRKESDTTEGLHFHCSINWGTDGLRNLLKTIQKVGTMICMQEVQALS